MSNTAEMLPKEIALLLAKRRFAAQFPWDDRIDPAVGFERASALLDKLELDELRNLPTEG